VNAEARLRPGEFVRGSLRIAGRELAASFDGGIAPIYAIAFALLANSIFMNEFFLGGTARMTGYFDLLPLLLAFFLPAVSMRLWAEERKSRTLEWLLTLPVSPLQAVLGKFAAALGIYATLLATSLTIPIMLVALGEPDLGEIAGGYVGLVLLGALFLALGGLLSALTSDQIVAFVTSVLAAFALVLLGREEVVGVLDGLFPSLRLGSVCAAWLAALPRYESFVRGVIELSSSLYFLLATALLLGGTALVLERHRG
jgi:ABC-type Na+ efflux pump permease subunit